MWDLTNYFNSLNTAFGEVAIFVRVTKDSYLAVKRSSTGEYKSKGSKFYSFAHRVSTEDDVKSILEAIRKEHFKSRHVCYAYRLDTSGQQYRANDDGEPSGTAGLPILNVLKSHQLSKTMVAVVRYFGGTKLGVAGLIEAYKTAAHDAVLNADIQEEFIYHILKLEFPYEELGNLMNCIAKSNFKIIDQSYEEEPYIKIAIRQSACDSNLLNLYSHLLNYTIDDLKVVNDHSVRHTYLKPFEGIL